MSNENTDSDGNPDEIDEEFGFLRIKLRRADGDDNPGIVVHID